MVVGEAIHNIMGGIENTGTVKQHNHKKKLRQRFDIIKKLGQGTFGKVQLGINKETGQEVAIKTIKKSKIESEADLVRIRREIQIMSSVQHPNIIHIYEVFENREKMVLVMEYAAGGELYDYLSERKVLDEEEARRIFRQIATACFYCHKHKICHRDLKLENILLDENNNAKIADFGLSNVFDDQRLLNTFCGSPLYASPEIVKGTPYHGPEVDCWSLGVLLYTLVYGAMPFDGSNFKRLVKQISQGDYFEPVKPSRASPLIREMLTVNPKHRADIEKICTHWWVNEGYNVSCLDISEELANQTPVRLDVLLSLAPPPPQLESDKLMLTGDEEANKVDSIAPTRSQSVGSLMELAHPAERRIMNLMNEEKTAPKRKLETTISTDKANVDKRKDKIIKENTVADITVRGTIKENTSLEDTSMNESIPLDRCSTQTISKEKMDVEPVETVKDPSLEGAACTELIEEAEKMKPAEVKKSISTSVSNKVLEGINEAPSQENVSVHVDKENVMKAAQEKPKVESAESEIKKPSKKKVASKKVLSDKNENSNELNQVALEKKPLSNEKSETKEAKDPEPEPPSKPVERRKSRIFEAAEKFQNMMSPAESKPMLIDKPKKVIIPGVSVDGFKKEFERKASLTQAPKSKSVSIKKESEVSKVEESANEKKSPSHEPIPKDKETEETESTPVTKKTDDMQERERVRNAVNIISSALDKEGTRKSKSRPCCMTRKPPVPFGVSGRSASGNIGIISPLSPPSGPKPFVRPFFEQVADQKLPEEENHQTSSAEITLKSATLPRRKTSRAEITLKYPTPKPATMEFVTEMAHNVEAYEPPPTQKSEIIVPVSGAPTIGFRGNEAVKSSNERIIPIAFEKQEIQEKVQSPPIKPPAPKPFQNQMSNASQTSNLSRQSTQDSDSDTIASTGEPIKKSDREYIIPIAVEGGGYVTPRAGSLEPNESSSSNVNRSKTKFGRARRLNTFFNDRDSEDESSPFSSLHRHGSIGRDSDNEDSKRDAFHMHRLRSTRPDRSNLEHADSISSGEEDDDEGFEILTAENLFSTLLSRVRDLTQRLNVDDNIRPGFPSSRLLSHFDHGTNFWNRIEHPLTRHSSLGRTLSRDRPITKTSTGNSFGVPWRRSVTRDLASDIDNVFQNSNTPPGQRSTGDDLSKEENLNLTDLNLKKLKLSDEDALALSYLTPSLSKRIQKQLLSQLAPSEIKKLHRANDTNEREIESKLSRKSADRMSSTLPRKFSVDSNRNFNSAQISKNETEKARELKTPRSCLPVKKDDYSRPSYEFSLRSSSIGAEPRGDSRFLHYRPQLGKSVSLVEPRNYSSPKSEIQSPESSISESLSSSHRNNDSLDSSSRYISDSSASRPCSKYSSDSYNRYVPNKSFESTPSITSIDTNKTDSKKSSSSTKRISRFLRPDFFEVPQEESVYLKEKKEREMETQKVLKEIRDKRKSRLNMRRERSGSGEKQVERIKNSPSSDKGIVVTEPDNLSNTTSNNMKILEENVKTIHDYENVPGQSKTINNETKTKSDHLESKMSKTLHDYVNVKTPEKNKKENISKIARPKSYPTENSEKIQTSPEKESKISKLRRGFNRPSKEKTKEEKNETNKIINEEDKVHKNKLLQSIEKKLEKLRSNNSSISKETGEHVVPEKKSTVESAIKRLREQSVPRNLEHCTESGLIKRAVSVEDLSSSTPLQASRKSVTKILGLFKKYEEHDDKRKNMKKTKTKEGGKNKSSNKETNNKSTGESSTNNDDKPSDLEVVNANVEVSQSESSQSEVPERNERTHSLFDKVRKFQNSCNSAKSDTILNSSSKKDSKSKSKLPVNSFRRSLNLDNLPEPPKFYKNPSKTNVNDNEKMADKRNLKLDFSKISSKPPETIVTEPSTSTSSNYGYENHPNENRNSLTTTDDSSTMLSPSDDYMSCDSWSVCSDMHHINDLHSPISPNGNHLFYSGDENESVRDRIRRKSFYTRFNEKKRPRRPNSFRDIDVNYKTPADYASLDRRSYDYKSPTNLRSFSSLQEPSRNYRPYVRSSSLLNDYVNVPNHYQAYNSKVNRPNTSIYSDFEENDTLDDLLSTAKSKKYSSHIQPSRLGRTSVSPVNEYYVDHSTSSVLFPTNSEPI